MSRSQGGVMLMQDMCYQVIVRRLKLTVGTSTEQVHGQTADRSSQRHTAVHLCVPSGLSV